MIHIDLPPWVAIIAALSLIVAGLMSLIGSVGLLRFGNFYERMHPATMASTLGTGGVLIASMLESSALLHRPVFHELLITVFMLMSSPVTAMLLMRAGVSRINRTKPDKG
jgi:multicomponent K+:H+ antiporter subunit G